MNSFPLEGCVDHCSHYADMERELKAMDPMRKFRDGVLQVSKGSMLELDAKLIEDQKEIIARITEFVQTHRENILLAFTAQYGCKPDEIEMVQEGCRWYLRKKERLP